MLDFSGKPNGKLGPMNPTNPALYDFVRNLFSEIVQVFPDQYLHLGGDEVPFDCWASNSEIAEYMRVHNMSKKYELLENEYIAKILAISNSLDANTIVWQEVNAINFILYIFLQLSQIFLYLLINFINSNTPYKKIKSHLIAYLISCYFSF